MSSRLVWLLAVLALGTFHLHSYQADAQTADADIVFVDHFDGSNVADSDDVAGFWKAVMAKPSQIAKSNGQLAMSVTGGDGSLPGIMMVSQPSADFNMFDRPLAIHIKGLSVSGDAKAGTLRFGLINQGNTSWHAPYAIYGQIRSDGIVFLYAKKNQPAAMGQILVNNIQVENSVGKVNQATLKLDKSKYELTVAGDKGQKVFSGEHGLKLEEWGNNGAASLYLEGQRLSRAGSETTKVTLDEVTVNSLR